MSSRGGELSRPILPLRAGAGKGSFTALAAFLAISLSALASILLRRLRSGYFPLSFDAFTCASSSEKAASRAKGPAIKLKSLPKDEVPERLRPDFYFDFRAHPFEHSMFITGSHDLIEVLEKIHDYTTTWIERKLLHRADSAATLDDLIAKGFPVKVVGRRPRVFVEQGGGGGGEEGSGEAAFAPDAFFGPLLTHSGQPATSAGAEASAAATAQSTFALHVDVGAQILGGTFDLRSGGIYIGAGAIVEPGVHIMGPTIVGRKAHLRHGAYLRGDVIVGEGAVLRGELKNCIVMDYAELAHPGYAGDSIIGYKGHFGCQALTANLGLFGKELLVDLHVAAGDGGDIRNIALGRRKVGVILGDGSQLGCGTVSDPATFIGPNTHVYPLARLSAGCYGPNEIVKNKPEVLGVLQREPMIKR